MAWPSPGGPMETFSPMSPLCSALDVWDDGGRGVGPGTDPRVRESQRLAIDALVEQGPAAYRDFLRQEGLPAFLSEPEVEHIVLHHQRPALHSHSGPAASSMLSLMAGPHRDDENSVNYEMGVMLAGGSGGEEDEDMGSGTYWPVFSDVTVPELELGWPSMPRSLGTTVSCYFQPPLEDGEPSIKEVVRKLIRGASKVVAVAMDVFSDVDVFSELVEVSGPTRRVPVYLVLDAIAFPLFWDMCSGLRLRLRDLQNMRIRTLHGMSYCCKSGVKIRGQSLERTLLVDARTVLSGSYSFSWSFEKLHRSVVHVFEGEAVRVFDDRFRILYAHSQPVDMARLLQPRPVPRGPDHPTVKAPAGAGGRLGPALYWLDPWQRQQGQQGPPAQLGLPGLLPGAGSFGSSGGLSLGPGDRLRYTRQQNSHQQQQQQQQQEADSWALGASGWPAGVGRAMGQFEGETLSLRHNRQQQHQQQLQHQHVFARQVVVEDSGVGWRRGELARGGGGGAAAIAYSRQQQQLMHAESSGTAQVDESVRRRLFRAELAQSREESRVLEARFALGDGGGLRDFMALQQQQQQQLHLHTPLGLDWGQRRGAGKPLDERRWDDDEAAPGVGAALVRDPRSTRLPLGPRGLCVEADEGPSQSQRRQRTLPWDDAGRVPDVVLPAPEQGRGLVSRWGGELKVGAVAEVAGQRLPGDGKADSPYWNSCRKPQDVAAPLPPHNRGRDVLGREAVAAPPVPPPEKGHQPTSAALLSRSKMSPLLQQNSRLRSSLIYANAAASRGPAAGDGDDAGATAGPAMGAVKVGGGVGEETTREGVSGVSKLGGVIEPRRLGVGEPGSDAKRGAIEELKREAVVGDSPAPPPGQASAEPGRAPGAGARSGEERSGRAVTQADPTRSPGLLLPEVPTALGLQCARDPLPRDIATRDPATRDPATRDLSPRDPSPRDPSPRDLSQKDSPTPAVVGAIRPKAAPTGSVFYRSLYLKPGSPTEPTQRQPALPEPPACSPTREPLPKPLALSPSSPWAVSPTGPAPVGNASGELRARNGVDGASGAATAVTGSNIVPASGIRGGAAVAAPVGGSTDAPGTSAAVATAGSSTLSPSPVASDGNAEENSGQLVRKLESLRKEGRAFSCFEALLKPGANDLQRQQEEERRKLDDQKKQEELKQKQELERSQQRTLAVPASDAGAATAVRNGGPNQYSPSSLRPLGSLVARVPVGHAYLPTTSYTWRRL